MKISKKWLGNIMLFLAAMIWGGAFVAQTQAMEHAEPFTFQAARFFLGGLVLIPVIMIRDKKGNRKKPVTKEQKKHQLFAGLVCGLILFAACSLQQLGLADELDAGKSGFITSLYIILVPIFGLFLKKRPKPWVWGSIVLALVGFYMLCGAGRFSMNKAEGLTLLCAVIFTFHIMFIDHVGSTVDGVRMSCMQFMVCGGISLVVALIAETPTWDRLAQCWLPIAYTGILSSGVGYTFQILGQEYTEPTTASLLMSLESVFSAIFGALILMQWLKPLELAGCTLVFAGVVISQLPGRKSS